MDMLRRAYITGMRVTGSAILLGNTITGIIAAQPEMKKDPGRFGGNVLFLSSFVAGSVLIKSVNYGFYWPVFATGVFFDVGKERATLKRHFCMFSSIEGAHLDSYIQKGFLPEDYSPRMCYTSLR